MTVEAEPVLDQNWVRNQKPGLVSVIIPTYNRGHIVEQAIESVLNQTYSQLELLVVDDGSSDNTRNVIQKIQDERVQFIERSQNGGQNAALNTGLEHAEGQFIAFLDSDDLWKPEFLEKLVNPLAQIREPAVAYCRAAIMEDGELRTMVPFKLEGWIYPEALTQGFVSHMITLVVRRECVSLSGPFDLSFRNCQDDDFCLRLAKHCPFSLVKEDLAIVRQGEDQVSVQWKDYADGWYRLFRKFEGDIKSHCGSRQVGAHFSTCFAHYHRARSPGGMVKSMFRAMIAHPPSGFRLFGKLAGLVLLYLPRKLGFTKKVA
ncbi:MAG: glycosyltransferase family 2 protein, partial [Leptospiraceae bacterium]|nr:glycosyltransferase family 2 protein [Leptospiraceae bacterium]